MELLCLTGVEDKLQVDVKPTLELLRNAGIKVVPYPTFDVSYMTKANSYFYRRSSLGWQQLFTFHT